MQHQPELPAAAQAAHLPAAYDRDLIGYAGAPPRDSWCGDARKQLALSIVLNYEEGGENCVLHGDAASEAFLSEHQNAVPLVGRRHLNIESVYEYGSRAGVHRIKALLDRFRCPSTVYAVGMAVERNPELIAQLAREGHEIASHGYRWIDYAAVPEDVERDHFQRAIDAIRAATGAAPTGWYTGRCSLNTRALVAERDHLLYSSDAYNDDLPYWDARYSRPLLVVPYTLDVNDMRMGPLGYDTSEYEHYLIDTFDMLLEEGITEPKMMNCGLHCRIVGRPGRARALQRFLEHVDKHREQVWITTRSEIARDWINRHPFAARVVG